MANQPPEIRSSASKLDATLPFSLIKKLLLGAKGVLNKEQAFSEISDEEWEMLAMILSKDKLEYFFHIEQPSEDNELLYPQIWDTHDWQISSEKRKKQKAKSAFDRSLRDLILKRVMEETGLPVDLARILRDGILRKPEDERAKVYANFGIDIEKLKLETEEPQTTPTVLTATQTEGMN